MQDETSQEDGVETARKLLAMMQAMRDVRTLDGWALACPGREVIADRTGFGGAVDCYVGLDNEDGHRKNFDGATPDEARAKAAAWIREQATTGGAVK